jgi:hypothetical protein
VRYGWVKFKRLKSEDEVMQSPIYAYSFSPYVYTWNIICTCRFLPGSGEQRQRNLMEGTTCIYKMSYEATYRHSCLFILFVYVNIFMYIDKITWSYAKFYIYIFSSKLPFQMYAMHDI